MKITHKAHHSLTVQSTAGPYGRVVMGRLAGSLTGREPISISFINLAGKLNVEPLQLQTKCNQGQKKLSRSIRSGATTTTNR